MLHYTKIISSGKCNINDTIEFTLSDGEKVEAVAVKEESDGMLFILTHCLKDKQPMPYKKNYSISDMRGYLNEDILTRFPENIKTNMIPFSNGDYLRLATGDEIFGDDDGSGRFEAMNSVKNRVATLGIDGEIVEWWIQDICGLFSFILIDETGDGDFGAYECGIRPVFKILNQ